MMVASMTSTRATSKEFPTKVVLGIIKHVNEDHYEEMLTCARAFGAPWATAATLEHFDRAGMVIRALKDEHSKVIRLEFAKAVEKNKDIQGAMLEVIDKAKQELEQEV
jgi:putative heme iron utilization protein